MFPDSDGWTVPDPWPSLFTEAWIGGVSTSLVQGLEDREFQGLQPSGLGAFKFGNIKQRFMRHLFVGRALVIAHLYHMKVKFNYLGGLQRSLF